MKRVSILFMLFLCSILVISSPLYAISIEELPILNPNYSDNKEVDKLAEIGWSKNGIQAEGRIGNNSSAGDWEVGLTSVNYQSTWDNGEFVRFEFKIEGSTASFWVGDSSKIISETIISSSEFDGLAIRTSTYEEQYISFKNLSLNTIEIDPFTNTLDDNNDSKSDRLATYMLISDVGDLYDGLTLTGEVALGWNSTNNLRGSKLAFQFKGMDAPNPVPEPATMILLGTGLVGIAGLNRKRLKKK